jgi:hypothetical protein
MQQLLLLLARLLLLQPSLADTAAGSSKQGQAGKKGASAGSSKQDKGGSSKREHKRKREEEGPSDEQQPMRRFAGAGGKWFKATAALETYTQLQNSRQGNSLVSGIVSPFLRTWHMFTMTSSNSMYVLGKQYQRLCDWRAPQHIVVSHLEGLMCSIVYHQLRGDLCIAIAVDFTNAELHSMQLKKHNDIMRATLGIRYLAQLYPTGAYFSSSSCLLSAGVKASALKHLAMFYAWLQPDREPCPCQVNDKVGCKPRGHVLLATA